MSYLYRIEVNIVWPLGTYYNCNVLYYIVFYYIIVYCILLYCIVISFNIVLVSLFQLWTPINLILFNLVCSDFSVSVLGNPFTLVSALSHHWVFGNFMCVIYGFFMTLLGKLSPQSRFSSFNIVSLFYVSAKIESFTKKYSIE